MRLFGKIVRQLPYRTATVGGNYIDLNISANYEIEKN